LPKKLPADIGLPELVKFFEREYFQWSGEGEPIGYVGAYTDFPNNELVTEEILDLKPEGRVLSLGEARGFIIKRLNDRGYESYGIDVSRWCMKSRVTNSLIRASATHLPFRDGCFDVAFSIELLEHLPIPVLNTALREISRVAKRGFHAVAYSGLFEESDTDVTHVNRQSLTWWREKLTEYNGFKIVDKHLDGRWPTIIGLKPMPPAREGPKLGLNIGSYTSMFRSTEKTTWINIDVLDLMGYAQRQGYIFKQMDVRQGLPYSDESVSLIYASHLIEHLSEGEGESFLKECYRVVKPNGLIRISTPNLRLLVYKYQRGEMGEFDDINLPCERAESQAAKLFELTLKGHATVYDGESLIGLMERIGFEAKEMPFKISQSKVMSTETYDQHPTLSLYVEGTKHEHS